MSYSGAYMRWAAAEPSVNLFIDWRHAARRDRTGNAKAPPVDDPSPTTGNSAHDAVKVARTVISHGYRWVVEVDLDAFFDRVNHDVLMPGLRGK